MKQKKKLKQDKVYESFGFKAYKFFEFFIPFFYLIGGMILLVKGMEMIKEFQGFDKWVMVVAIFLMMLGVCGKYFQEVGLDKVIKDD